MTASLPSTSNASSALQLRRLLLVSFLFEVVGYAVDQRMGSQSSGLFWLALSTLLLFVIYRRHSFVAWLAACCSAAYGIVVLGSALALGTPSSGLFALAMVGAWLGQLLPLVSPAVRRHVRRVSAAPAGATG